MKQTTNKFNLQKTRLIT